MNTKDAAAEAAMADYRRRRDELRERANNDRKSQRPLHARKVDAAVRRLHRAALAEELDPPPTGLGTFA